MAVTIGGLGLGGHNLVSADVASGDRPVFVPITPCRLMDTRPAPNRVGVAPGPMNAGDTFVVPVSVVTAPNGKCPGVPVDAVGVSLNVTALNATEQTFLTFFGATTNPGTANLNPAPGEPPTPNAVNTPLDGNGSLQVYNDAGTVDVVIDMNGYYVGHNHDDRYAKITDVYPKAETYAKTETYSQDEVYTKTEVDALLAAHAPSGFTTEPVQCLADSTTAVSAYENCSGTLVQGRPAPHTALVTATFGYDTPPGGATGECELRVDGVTVPNATISVGEISQTSQNPALSHATVMSHVTSLPGASSPDPLTSLHTYHLACRQVVGDLDWYEVKLHVTIFPAYVAP